MSARESEGWFGPMGAKRYHWFGADGRSLCGKYLQLTHPQDAGWDWGEGIGYTHIDDCAECSRKLAARVPVGPEPAAEEQTP